MHIDQCLFVYSLAQEGFDYVYSTVNKKKKSLNQPRQEISKTESSKLQLFMPVQNAQPNGNGQYPMMNLSVRDCVCLLYTEILQINCMLQITSYILQVEAEHVHSTVCKDSKASCWPSHGCSP